MHQELFALKWGLEQFRSYILGRRVEAVTDYANLKWLTTLAPQQVKVARGCMSMAEFDFFIEHKKGERNVVPDVLSRSPIREQVAEDNVVILPETGFITVMIILTAVFVPHHTPDLIRRTFHPTMVCLHHASIVPEANSCDPICLATATERKTSLKPQPSS